MSIVKPVQSTEDYEAARSRLREVFQAEMGTPEAEERDLLVDEIERYERVHYPIPPPTAIDMIEFCMDQLGMTAVDLVPCVGSIGEVEELLAGRLPITLDMARSLEKLLGARLVHLEGVEGVGQTANSQEPKDLSETVSGSSIRQG